jgi:hypothetical protein
MNCVGKTQLDSIEVAVKKHGKKFIKDTYKIGTKP